MISLLLDTMKTFSKKPYVGENPVDESLHFILITPAVKGGEEMAESLKFPEKIAARTCYALSMLKTLHAWPKVYKADL